MSGSRDRPCRESRCPVPDLPRRKSTYDPGDSAGPSAGSRGRAPASAAAGIRTPALGIWGRFHPQASHARSRSASGFAADPGRRCRPVSARLGPPDPSDVAARLQRAERSEPRDGCLMVVVGDPGAFGWTSPSRWRMGSCASPRAMAGTAHRWWCRSSRPDLSTEPAPLRIAPHNGTETGTRELCGVVRGHPGRNSDATERARATHFRSARHSTGSRTTAPCRVAHREPQTALDGAGRDA